MTTRVLVLGRGFVGLKLCTRLAEVTLVDQSESFSFGLAKLNVMFDRRTADEGGLQY